MIKACRPGAAQGWALSAVLRGRLQRREPGWTGASNPRKWCGGEGNKRRGSGVWGLVGSVALPRGCCDQIGLVAAAAWGGHGGSACWVGGGWMWVAVELRGRGGKLASEVGRRVDESSWRRWWEVEVGGGGGGLGGQLGVVSRLCSSGVAGRPAEVGWHAGGCFCMFMGGLSGWGWGPGTQRPCGHRALPAPRLRHRFGGGGGISRRRCRQACRHRTAP